VRIVISSIKDPIGRSFETRTKRLQYWKAFFEVAPLADFPPDEVKELCRHELAEADDETQKLRDKFTLESATALTLVLMFSYSQSLAG
jgi:hypothetical protein